MKNILVLLAASVLMSCSNSQTLDLANIDLNQPAEQYLGKLKISNVETQKGHWELNKSGGDTQVNLVDNGEVSKVYNIEEASDDKQISFFGYSIDPLTGGKIVEYKNKVAFYSFYLEKSKTFDILEKLKSKLGQPTGTIADTILRTNENVAVLSKELPKTDVKEVEDSFGSAAFSYPRHYIWKKDGILYQYTLILGPKSIDNKIVVIDINTFKDRIVFGYHTPTENPILGSYLN